MSKLRLLFIVVAMTFGSSVAWGQNNISLNGTGSGIVNFAALGGGNLSLSLGACIGGANCIDGSASGNGVFGGGSPPLNGFYEISGAAVDTLTLISAGLWNITGSTFNFAFTQFADGLGTNFLSGTLALVNLGQSGSSGTLNTNFQANLTGLSGSLASLFTSSGGRANISLDLSTSTDLSTLTSATGSIDHGSISQTPEASSMLLFGSGLLMAGGILRRKLRAC
jgi:hypothetical protein